MIDKDQYPRSAEIRGARRVTKLAELRLTPKQFFRLTLELIEIGVRR